VKGAWRRAGIVAAALALALIPRSGLHAGRLRATPQQMDRGLAFDGVLQGLFFP
jgi:hypothetical protein